MLVLIYLMALCSKLINVAVPGTIDERAINTKRVINLWERNENHTLCLNSAKAIGCTVVNIGTQDLVEGRVSLANAASQFRFINRLISSSLISFTFFFFLAASSGIGVDFSNYKGEHLYLDSDSDKV